jgi:nuclear transport factor 2 (NTF2) superfamily protein
MSPWTRLGKIDLEETEFEREVEDMRTVGVVALCLLLATAVAAEQLAKPDFSGTWKFNQARSGLESNAPTKSIFVIHHQDPSFRLTRAHTWGERADTLSFEVTTDGEEHYRKEGQDGEYESWTRLSWLGDELVLDMKLAYSGEEGTNVVHYRLADEGRRFIAVEWYHMPKTQHHNYWTFDRVEKTPFVEGGSSLEEFAERYSAAWSSQDPDKVAAFFSENGSLRVNDGEAAVGREAIAGVAQEFMTALPDMVVIFDKLEERDERVLFHWTLWATNSGPGGTGKRVCVSGYESWLLDESGLVAESQGHFPTAEYERQLEVGI